MGEASDISNRQRLSVRNCKISIRRFLNLRCGVMKLVVRSPKKLNSNFPNKFQFPKGNRAAIKLDENAAFIKTWVSLQDRFTLYRIGLGLPSRNDAIKFLLAAWRGDSESLKESARRSWGIAGKSIDGWTAMHSAVWNMHVEVVKYLLTIGKWKTWQLKKGSLSLLHFAVRNNDIETLRLLLDSNADVDFIDSHRQTALHQAAVCGNVEAIRVLLAAGANVCIFDSFGKLPSDIVPETAPP
jgi:ankyrin repeat protein